MSSPATAGLSRSPPSVTIPVAPRASARAARMSPIVPAPGLAARVDHEHLVGPDRLDRTLLRVQLGDVGVADVLAQRHVAQRVGVAEQAQIGPCRAEAAA